MTLNLDAPLLLVGAGKMGGAMLAGWLEQGLDPLKIQIQDPAPPEENLDLFAKYELQCSPVADLDEPAAIIVLAIKPQLMDDVAPALKKHVGERTLVLSIAAGRTLTNLAGHLGSDTPIVRAMPNTPAAIGRGITVACANSHVTEGQVGLCTDLLSSVGTVAWVNEEAAMDPVTAVSGSGPAYVFLLAECLANAGIEAGLDASLAKQLARETVAGAGELLRQSDRGPARLRENVTSPGGTTAAALEILMSERGLQELMNRAVRAATQRSRELSS